MVTRQNLAHFLLGFSVVPVCALMGGMEAMFFKWTGIRAFICVAVFALFPLLGALKTRQRILALGIGAGIVATVAGYFVLR